MKMLEGVRVLDFTTNAAGPIVYFDGFTPNGVSEA